MKRWLPLVLLLVGLQGAFVALWLTREGGGGPGAAEPNRDRAPLGSAPRVESLHRPDAEVPELALHGPHGETAELAALRGRPLLLHFWATWCPPCREELPSLLRFASEHDVRVRAVALDSGWDALRGFFDGSVPPGVVRAEAATARSRFELRRLPETWLVDTDGIARLRFVGPRRWASGAAPERVLGRLGGGDAGAPSEENR